MPHPTQIFLSNPQALRVEYRCDDERLELWWSPRAGTSSSCEDRNYSARDAHLDVFAQITLPGCGLGAFQRCDYDPYHVVLHFASQVLHLALRPDVAAVWLWTEAPQVVDLAAHRHDVRLASGPEAFAVVHTEPRYTLHQAAVLAPGAGTLRTSLHHAPGNPLFARADLAAGQALVIGIGEAHEGLLPRLTALARQPVAEHLAATEALLAPHEAAGRITAPAHPALMHLRRTVVRTLHSMIDESGAYRASLKAIYYLIWVRDSGFSFAYQAAAGWPHRLDALCRLLLANPLSVTDAGQPPGRMFGQLINTTYGKREEDGLYYVVWMLFTRWTQQGGAPALAAADRALVDEALAWVDARSWDPARGLYGEAFADETPVLGARDHGWDHAIGMPTGTRDVIRHQGVPVRRNYDVYFNLLMHSTHVMLAALTGDAAYRARAEALWPALRQLLDQRVDGLPAYGQVELEDGHVVTAPAWGAAQGCHVWGLSMPSFAPLEDWDAVHGAVLDAIIAKPEMHFINGIGAAISAVDPWIYPEDRALALLTRVADESARPGKYLPMGGAMPEKFAAPEGNLYHDIRPQGFAMGAWLAAFTSLGLRRLPYGLALRPTAAFTTIEAYAWRGRTLTVRYAATGRGLALVIQDTRIPGTLQIPESALTASGPQEIRLEAAPAGLLWLRSTVQLDAVDGTTYRCTAYGPSEIVLSARPTTATLTTPSGTPIPHRWHEAAGLAFCRFTHDGPAVLQLVD